MSDRSADFLAEIEATATVTVPLRDLRRLIDAVLDGAASGTARCSPVPSRSPIAADPEVALFLVERFGSTPVDQILIECQSHFGQERTPSRTSAYAFWRRLREQSERLAAARPQPTRPRRKGQ